MSRTIRIVSRYDSTEVLFDCEVPDDIAAGTEMRHALEKATAAGADLDGANLARANLTGANLDGANLDGANLARANLTGVNLDGANLARANLTGANLDGANLAGTNLDGANLARANLTGANLDGANLDGANLASKTLVGKRPIFQIGPIGSRSAYLVAYLTDAGVMIRAGCFFDGIDKFRAAVNETHGDNEHAQEYTAATALIETHARLWSMS